MAVAERCHAACVGSLSVRDARAFVGAAVVAAVLTAALPSPASAVIVARPVTSTDVREHDGTIVFSELDVAQMRFRLVVRKVGADPQRVNVPMSRDPFGADIGTDSRGRPQLIYRRCRTAPSPSGCELFVYSLADATGERRVRTVGVIPWFGRVTLWRGRIAWTQGQGPGLVVLTKLITAPRSQPATRLPGVPRRRCADREPVCPPTGGGDVRDLELWGTNLALIVGYDCPSCRPMSQAEVRLDNVADRSARKVAQLGRGPAGERLAGPSFFDGRLAWYRGCLAAEPTCRSEAGPWRYRLSTRTYERGAPGPLQIEGFADTGRLHYAFLCSSETQGGVLNTGCRIEENTPPTYRPAGAPLR